MCEHVPHNQQNNAAIICNFCHAPSIKHYFKGSQWSKLLFISITLLLIKSFGGLLKHSNALLLLSLKVFRWLMVPNDFSYRSTNGFFFPEMKPALNLWKSKARLHDSIATFFLCQEAWQLKRTDSSYIMHGWKYVQTYTTLTEKPSLKIKLVKYWSSGNQKGKYLGEGSALKTSQNCTCREKHCLSQGSISWSFYFNMIYI